MTTTRDHVVDVNTIPKWSDKTADEILADLEALVRRVAHETAAEHPGYIPMPIGMYERIMARINRAEKLDRRYRRMSRKKRRLFRQSHIGT